MGMLSRVRLYGSEWMDTDISRSSWTFSGGDAVDVPVMVSEKGVTKGFYQGSVKNVVRPLSSINSIVIHTTGPWDGPSQRARWSYSATQLIRSICRNESISRDLKTALIRYVLEDLPVEFAAFREITRARSGIKLSLKNALSEDEMIEHLKRIKYPPLLLYRSQRPDSLFFFQIMHGNLEPDEENFGDYFFKSLTGLSYCYNFAINFPYKGHFLIDWSGTIFQVVPLNLIAEHAGGNIEDKLNYDEYVFDNSRPYNGKRGSKNNERRFEYWGKRWPDRGISKITELPAWLPFDTKYSVNRRSIGIDMLAVNYEGISDRTGSPTDWTDAQYESLAKLTNALTDDPEMNILKKKEHILGHEDVHPETRVGCCPGKKWDWDRLYRLCGIT